MNKVFQHKLQIVRTVEVSCYLNDTDWQLYSMSGVEAVAGILNETLCSAVKNLHSNKDSVRQLVLATMWTYKRFGCTDTEPRAVLENILDEIYGE